MFLFITIQIGRLDNENNLRKYEYTTNDLFNITYLFLSFSPRVILQTLPFHIKSLQ